MKLRVCWGLVLLALGLCRGESDWSHCPPTLCSCKWASGKKTAECVNRGLSTVPDRLSPEIQSIDLSSNNLTSLPGEAFKSVGLTNLHKIFLRECNIQELHKDTFKGLQIIIELDLSHNMIHYLHPVTFRDNVRLRRLHMHHNPITKLEDGLFTNMTFLQTVNMNHCQLSHIGHKTFVNTPALQNLHLANNSLEHMEVAAVAGLNRLISLELQHNPWRCDCHLKAFRDWTIEKGLYAQPTACSGPPHLANRYWTDVTSAEFGCEPQITHSTIITTTVEAYGEEVTLSPR